MKRILGWTLFALALAALGWGLHVVAKPGPTWSVRTTQRFSSATLEVFPEPMKPSADETTFFVVSLTPESPWGFAGPIVARSLVTGEEIGSYWNDRIGFSRFAFSADGRWTAGLVASAPDDAELRWLDLTTRQERKLPLPDGGNVSKVLFVPNGESLFVVGSLLHEVHLPTGRVVSTLPVAHNAEFRFSDDGRLFFFNVPARDATEQSDLLVWDTRQRQGLARIADVGPSFLTSADGRFLLTQGRQRTGVWDLTNPKLPEQRERFSAVEKPLQLSPDGRVALLFTPDRREDELNPPGMLQVRDVQAKSRLMQMPLPKASSWMRNAREVTFTPDQRHCLIKSRYLALGLGGGQGETRQVLSLEKKRVVLEVAEVVGGGVSTPSMKFTPDSRYILRASPESVERFDLQTEKEDILIRWPTAPDNWSGFWPVTLRVAGRHAFVCGVEAQSDEALPWWQRWLPSSIQPSSATGGRYLFAIDWMEPCTVFRVKHPHPLRDFLPFNDGRSVLTFHSEESDGPTTIRRYDLDARAPLALSLGVPMALGTCVLLLRGWLLRRRHRAQLAPACNQPEI